ncbi:NUCLEAR FUSION DEFECTIVE 4 [Olea europaea subsp. europaea]|uniref:NUCLEAR FUSION DEFECTIVE 4 n=1 Tax=Olea europaea subsp. europaea TaxID=158383 RepID=A0A8S0SN47_OLEEU|nr:NUCLEAR FUSION DEFECTIVE 4 [Olea europaea subsp. europaea]
MEPPWVGLGAAVRAEIAAGSAYTFPLYSPSLKSVLGFNQKQLTFLGVANDIGENVEILPVIACNKFPPRAVLLVGALASFLGYGVLYLSVSQTVQSLPYWVVSSAFPPLLRLGMYGFTLDMFTNDFFF